MKPVIKSGVVISAICAAWLIALWRAQIHDAQQGRLNAALFRAVDTDDFNAANAALQAGASVDVRRRVHPPSPWEPIDHALTHLWRPTAKFDQGFTPLMIASIHGDVPMATLLLNHGAKTEYFNSYAGTDTPLELAVTCKHTEMVITLLKHGANPSGAADCYGPIYIAWLQKDTAITKLLASYGARPLPASITHNQQN